MSTTNPDDLSRRIGERLKPLALVVCVVAVLFAPVVAVLHWSVGFPPALFQGLMVADILIAVGGGLLALRVPGQRSGYGVAAYILTYAGGLFLLIRAGDPFADREPIIFTLVLIGGPYVAAAVLAVLYLLRRFAVAVTTESGVDTTAEVISAPVDGMVNYVQHQRLTLKFTDREGTVRYVRVGRTGGGFSAGDKLPLRYDPARPWSKRSMIVGH